MRSRKSSLPIPTEHDEQKMLVKLLRAHNILFSAIPNAAKRSPQTAAILKAEGMEAGAPDLLIFTPPPLIPTIRGVAIEMKRTKGSVTSEDQLRWHECLRGLNWSVFVAYGATKAIDHLASLGYWRLRI